MVTVFLGFALLASAMIANKVALVHIPTILFVAIRMLGAGCLLIAYYWGKTHRIKWSYFKYDLPVLLSISVFTTLIPSIFKAYALKHMIAAKFSLLGSIDPFITALYSYILWQERLDFKKIVGMLLGFVGVIIMLGTTAAQESSLYVFNMLSYPELAAVAAPLLGRIGWMLVQKLVRADRYTPAEINGITMASSGFAALLLSYPTESWQIHWGTQWFGVAIALLYTIIVGNIIALTMYATFLKHYSATFISLAGFSVNFFVAIYGWMLLGEIPPYNFFIAALIMLAGLMVFYSTEMKRLTA